MQYINDQHSPFHSGEKNLQTRTGKREAMESFGRRVIRSFMPDQHRQFYATLPFMVVGGVDKQGWPWTSLLSGKPGFMQSPHSTTLNINATLPMGDPLAKIIKQSGSPLGLLGIEMTTRRRNRLNGRITHTDDSGFSLQVDQSFGNCPQYIQNWKIHFVREPNTINTADMMNDNITTFNSLDAQARHLIKTADTFFVSSFINTKNNPEIEGVDVSHRGGRPGFVKIEDDTLTIPDFPGNNHFNTLGNFLVNPKAGMTFIDFSTGELLMLTGTVELLWEDEPEVIAYKGAERAWRFKLNHGIRLKDALPFRGSIEGYSPNTLITGDWKQAATTLAAEKKRNSWRPFKLSRIETESHLIRSFYFEPADHHGLLPFSAGQFLTLRIPLPNKEQPVLRTYTVSSAPGETHYKISVKREVKGYISQALHDNLKVNDIIEIKAPRGDFFIDTVEHRPAVLIGAGVGITPMISMASHVLTEGVRTRHMRPLTILQAPRTTAERAFHHEFQSIEKQSQGKIRYHSFISAPRTSEKIGVDFSGTGRLSAHVLRKILALDDYDFFLCGPPEFMQALYDMIRSLGVSDARILAEAFGLAALQRQPDNSIVSSNDASSITEEAQKAVITFTQSNIEQDWNAGDATLLETAEAQGITPNFSCRHGVCGACATKIKAGSVTYRSQASATHAKDEVLIYCAVPAKGTEALALVL
ncbi:FAD-binding oxidoreductase [Shewanella surugensis]|uniref:FAD-binding oxidoreductase n=1 Tax=Shewanella surugensis TaxID=212020 RepID=A0ABT0LI99_9GAMM|nr:pyridoxamine 5'-phosphate oxidase family protein [Shewanella surugensis]MCL1127442.1 FAD-binding oxidoreductase [Shewanella surugensis]